MANSSQPLDPPWQGQSAAEMAAAATPLSQLLHHNGDAAGKAATVTSEIVAAFETARASATSPTEVAANRHELEQLVATDVLGLNTAAIATNQADHQQMEARSQQAMVAYRHQAMMVAAQLTQFPQAPTTDMELTPRAETDILQSLETITEQLFTGPGPESMFGAANSWDELSQDFAALAGWYDAIIQHLVASHESLDTEIQQPDAKGTVDVGSLSLQPYNQIPTACDPLTTATTGQLIPPALPNSATLA